MIWSHPLVTRSHPYTGARPTRKPVAAALVAATLVLGGCSSASLGDYARDDAIGTAASSGVASVDRSDWDTVRRTLAQTPVEQAARQPWSNPRTGSSGHVTVLALADDEACRPFATSVNDQRGIRQYRGDACLRNDGRWELLGISADDALLL